MGYVEKCVGRPAPFKVYYIRKGKMYWDAIYAPGADEAKSQFLAACKELRWKVEVVRVVANVGV